MTMSTKPTLTFAEAARLGQNAETRPDAAAEAPPPAPAQTAEPHGSGLVAAAARQAASSARPGSLPPEPAAGASALVRAAHRQALHDLGQPASGAKRTLVDAAREQAKRTGGHLG